MTGLTDFAPTLIGVGALVAITIAVLWGSHTPHRFAPAMAILRGAAQLAVISVILGGVITSPLWVSVALLVMFSVAAATATRRLRWSWNHFGLVSAAMASGILVTLLSRLQHRRDRLHPALRPRDRRHRDRQHHVDRHPRGPPPDRVDQRPLGGG